MKWIFTAHPVALTAAIQRGSGQSAKVEAILWNSWNRKLCETLSGLGANLANAAPRQRRRRPTQKYHPGIQQPTANHTMNSIFEQLFLNNRYIQAAANGDTALVGNLLDQGADIHAACSCALRRATANGHSGTVALLLDRGADIHAVQDLALRSAVKGGDLETTALLLGRYKTSELQSLQNTTQSGLSGMDKLLPLVRMEIARRLVQKCISDQPALEI